MQKSKPTKLLSIVLSLIMLLSMFPLAASAAVTLPSGASWYVENSIWYKLEGDTITFGGEGQIPGLKCTASAYADYFGGEFSKLVIEDGITSLKMNAFSGMVNLEEVSIPSTVLKIDWYAFENCSNLKIVHLSEGLEEIGQYAFQNTALEEIKFPKSLKNLGSYSFSKTKFKTFEFPEGVSCGSNIVTSENLETVIIACDLTTNSTTFISNLFTSKNSNLKTIIVKGSAKKIPGNTFSYTNYIETFIVEDGVTTFDESVYFNNTSTLKAVYLPDSITSIGRDAFYKCSNLETFNIPANLEAINGSFLAYAPKIKSLTIPESVKEIGMLALSYDDLTKVTFLNDTPPTVNSYAFEANTSTINFYVPINSLSQYTTVLSNVADCTYNIVGGYRVNIPADLKDSIKSDFNIAPAGETVTVTVDTANIPARQKLVFIDNDGIENDIALTDGMGTFTMPESDVTIGYVPYTYTYTAEDNVLTATANDADLTAYTLSLTENGTIATSDIPAWQEAGLTLPEIAFDTTANTASITAGDATATVALPTGALQAHSVKVICGADADGNSYITDVMAGTTVTVTAGTYEGKAFEKWNAALSVDGSTDETVTFTMPNEDVTLEAEFVDCYALSVFDGTTLTSEPQKVNTSATVTAPTAPEGMRFKNWTADGLTLLDSTAPTLTFTMPDNAVMLTANYIAPHSVTVEGGTTTNAGASSEAFAGDTVSITANADTNDARFTQWSSEADITFADKTSKTTTFIMPDADVSVAAQTEQSHTVTVTDGKVTAGLNGANKAFAGQTITIEADTISGHNFTGWTGEGVGFANAASATTTFTMPESDVSVKANHEAIKVAPPTAGTKTYTYNAEPQTYEFASEGDVSYYELTGDSDTQFDAGTYTIKAHLTVDGTVWTDGTTADKEFTFVIGCYPLDKPEAYDTEYYYDGTEKEFILCKKVGSTYYYYESTIPYGTVIIENNTRTDAGTQTVTATPAENFCWSDGTTDALSFDFTVKRYPMPVLFDDPRDFAYNGKEHTYTPFVRIGSGAYDLDGLYYDLTNRKQTMLGKYTVTATPNDNFCWYDGSTAQRNMSFKIENPTLDSYIYYVEDLKTGNLTSFVDISYTQFDDISCLKGFSKHPKFQPDMLKDRYKPYLCNVPKDASVIFCLKEDMVTPKTTEEINKCRRWDATKMSDLKPNTTYYVFAVVWHPDYSGQQVTEITECSSFRTSALTCMVTSSELVTEEEINMTYAEDIICTLASGPDVRDLISVFASKKSKKKVNFAAKTEFISDFYEAIYQGVQDVEEGLDSVTVMFDYEGETSFYRIDSSNVGQFKSVLRDHGFYAAPKRMLAAPTEDPSGLVPITGVTGEPAELTPALLEAMFGADQIDSLLLNDAEFSIPMDLEIAPEQMEESNAALLEKLEAAGLIAEAGEPDDSSCTVTVNGILYDPATGLVEGERNAYVLTAGEKLPAAAAKEIEGFTLDGFYYKDIFDFEKDVKSEEATGDHGRILTQGLVKWDPETDHVNRDVDLWAIYVKNGADEPVGYKADGTTFLDEGSEAVITLPILAEGMTYGDVVNDNADITVSAAADGKVSVTLNNDVTGDEPFTFTVAVNANSEGIEDPFYHILVTVNAIDDTEIKEEAKTAIEALAGDTASDEVKAIIAYAVAALADANSIEAVNKIVADTMAAVELQTAKEDAIAAIDAAIEADDPESVTTAAEEAKAAIENAESVDEVEAAKTSGLEKMEDVRGRCPYCGEKGHKNWIDKLFCIIKRVIRVIEMFFGLADDVNALC